MVTTGRGVAGLGSWKGRCSESEKGGVRTRKERERRTSRVENIKREMRAWFESIFGRVGGEVCGPVESGFLGRM